MTRYRPARRPLRPVARLLATAGLGLALVLAAGAGVAAKDLPFGKGLLWTVERAGAAPSHVFGTLHLSDERVTTLPAPVARVFAAARSLTVETVHVPGQEQRMVRRMLLPEGRQLDFILGARLFDEVQAVVGRYGVPTGNLLRFKPWAVMTMIAVPPEELARQQAGKLPLDRALSSRARARGVPVHGLETVDEQLDLFDGMAEKDQIVILRQAVRDNAKVGKMIETMTRYYLARDITGLLDWMARQMAGEDRHLLDVFWSRFINARNALMVERMQKRLAEGGAFIAVGAAHLPGEKGVLSLLQRRGYRIKRVY